MLLTVEWGKDADHGRINKEAGSLEIFTWWVLLATLSDESEHSATSLHPVPHTCLFRLHCFGIPPAVHVLGEPNVCYAGSVIAHQVYMRVQDDGVDGFIAFGQSWKEKNVEQRT